MDNIKLPLQHYRYLIIGGTTKAGTTSLHRYLCNHPQICKPRRKEIRFFLDEDYPLKRIYSFTNGLNKYNEFFKGCNDNMVRLDVTPDYLYSIKTPERINQSLSDVKFIFSLRNPVERLISWYRFSIQNYFISRDMPFKEYVRWQIETEGHNNRAQHQLTLEQGRYYGYLKKYHEFFDSNNILIILFEQLREDPIAVMKKICSFSDINGDFYNNYDFKVHNPTYDIRYPLLNRIYNEIAFNLRRIFFKKDNIRNMFKNIKTNLDSIYLRINTEQNSKDIAIDDETMKFLTDYYREDIQKLEDLTEIKTGW
jgi:hypothetical protein